MRKTWRTVIRVMRHKGAIVGGQHPAVLAVGMVEELILAYTKPTAFIFDPFLGSASVTIAALKTGRRAYGTEISAAYCDVALRRVMALTNEMPVLQVSGPSFADLANLPVSHSAASMNPLAMILGSGGAGAKGGTSGIYSTFSKDGFSKTLSNLE